MQDAKTRQLSKIYTVKKRAIKTSVSQYWRRKNGFKQHFIVYPQEMGAKKNREMISCFLTVIDSEVVSALNSFSFNLIRLTGRLYFRDLRSVLQARTLK